MVETTREYGLNLTTAKTKVLLVTKKPEVLLAVIAYGKHQNSLNYLIMNLDDKSDMTTKIYIELKMLKQHL